MMSFKKLFPVLTSFLVAASLLFTACGSDSSTTTSTTTSTNAEGKYDPPITMTAMRFLGPQVKYAEGESIENNIWTRTYEEKLGIKIKYSFTSPDFQTFDTKVNMAIASNSLPDIMPFYTTLFFRAADSGRCADLTEVYNKYASKDLKDLQNYSDIIAKTCTRNGKLLALAGPPNTKYGGLMMVRTDWLKKLNLSEPKNMDDVIKIAKAFADNDLDGDGEKNFGLALNKDLGGIGGFMNGYHAYPGMWVEKDGKLERGEVQPEMKTALSKLAELYEYGAIDEEFILKSDNDLKQDFAREAIGLTYPEGPGTVEDSVKSNPDAEWGAFTYVSCDDKPALAGIEPRIGNFISVSANCKYPEAMIKLANLELKMKKDPATSRDYHDKDGINTFWYPVIGCYTVLYEHDYNIKSHELVVEAINSGDTSKLNGEQKGYYDRCKAWIDNKDTDSWSTWRAFGPGGTFSVIKDYERTKQVYLGKAWGPETPAWKENGPNLSYKSAEFFTYIIIGEKSIDEFDNWVKYFYENGGKEATEQINEWYQQNK